MKDLGVAHEKGEEWVAVVDDVKMNVRLKPPDLAYVLCKGWALIADGVMIGSDPLKNVTKQKIA